MIDVQERRATEGTVPVETPIRVRKIGHVVYRVTDIDRSTKFWTEIMGFKVSDVNENGMVFLRCQGDHHTVALARANADATMPSAKDKTSLGMDHFAMELASVEDLFRARDFLRSKGVNIVMEGRRGPGANMGVEFTDPDGYMLELYADMEQIGWNNKSRPSTHWRRASSLEDALANPCPTD